MRRYCLLSLSRTSVKKRSKDIGPRNNAYEFTAIIHDGQPSHIMLIHQNRGLHEGCAFLYRDNISDHQVLRYEKLQGRGRFELLLQSAKIIDKQKIAHHIKVIRNKNV